MNSSESQRITLSEGIARCLEFAGIEVLRTPQRFATLLNDVCQGLQSPELSILLQNCDAELLAPFVNATSAGSASVEDLQNAALATATFLQSYRSVASNTANSLAGQMMAGIVRYLGLIPAQGGGSQAPTEPHNNVSPAPSAPLTQPKHDKKPSKPIIIGAIAGIVIVILIVVVVVVIPSFRASITIYDTQNGKTTEQEIEGWKGGTATLPEPIAENDGYEFVGWIPDDKSTDDAIVQPGEEVEMEDGAAYRGVWIPQVSFDGNSADGGAMDSVGVKINTEYVLPECDFTKKGCAFVGWSTEKDDRTHTTSAGTTVYISKPTTYYAVWAPQLVIGEASVKSVGDVSGTIDGWDPAMGSMAVLVKNDTNQVLSFRTHLAEKNEAGSTIEDTTEYTNCVGPGEGVLVGISSTKNKKGATASYSIEAKEAIFYEPISGLIKTEVLSQKKDEVTLKITNTGNKELHVSNVALVAKDETGTQYAADSFYYATLKPNESGEVTFADGDMFVYGHMTPDWSKADCTFYINGDAVRNP